MPGRDGLKNRLHRATSFPAGGKNRLALADAQRGDQRRLEEMQCVGLSTVSTWKAAAEVMDAIEWKHELTQVSNFQPTHAVEIAPPSAGRGSAVVRYLPAPTGPPGRD
jgi:hypothetical protein